MATKPVPFVKVFLPVRPASDSGDWSRAQWPAGLSVPEDLYTRGGMSNPRNIPVVENTYGGLWIWAIEEAGGVRVARAGEVGLRITRAKSDYVRYEYKVPVKGKLREVYTAVIHVKGAYPAALGTFVMPAWFFSRGAGTLMGGKPTINDLTDLGWDLPTDYAVLRDLVLENAKVRLVRMPTDATDQCCAICQRSFERHEWVIQFTVPQAGAGLFFAHCHEDEPESMYPAGTSAMWLEIHARRRRAADNNKEHVSVGEVAEVHPECIGLSLPEA